MHTSVHQREKGTGVAHRRVCEARARAQSCAQAARSEMCVRPEVEAGDRHAQVRTAPRHVGRHHTYIVMAYVVMALYSYGALPLGMFGGKTPI